MKSPIASNLITAIVFLGEGFFTESKKVSNINKIISKKLTDLFDTEKDPVQKIILLASRIDTIRKRIDQIQQDENNAKIIQENSNESSNEEEVKFDNDTEKNEKINFYILIIIIWIIVFNSSIS